MLKDLKPRHTLSEFVDFAWKTPMHEFTDTYALNCTASYYTVLAFLELLDEGNKSRYQGGKSQVIATASTASFLRDPRAGYAYLSSKAAVISLIKALSTFCVPWGIRFNAIAAGCPYFVFFFPLLRALHTSDPTALDVAEVVEQLANSFSCSISFRTRRTPVPKIRH